MPSKVLVIDDEWAIAKALCRRLSECGFEMISAPDGPTGIMKAADTCPDAILLDLRMPDMDGFEVFRRLRSDETLRHIPVIFLSANVQDTAKQEAKAMGAADFFSKPYHYEEIAYAISTAVSQSVT
ncbi:MAG: response regulator [Phycisphaerales bacterium JB052]